MHTFVTFADATTFHINRLQMEILLYGCFCLKYGFMQSCSSNSGKITAWKEKQIGLRTDLLQH